MNLKTVVMAVLAVATFSFTFTLIMPDMVQAGRNYGYGSGMHGGMHGQKGGFRESREPEVAAFEVITVKQAKDAKDDTFVVLQGYIEKSLGGEKYLFRDETGTIKLEIEDKKFRGMTVYPDDFVQVSGEVDKGFFKETRIEVKNISKKNLPTGSSVMATMSETSGTVEPAGNDGTVGAAGTSASMTDGGMAADGQ